MRLTKIAFLLIGLVSTPGVANDSVLSGDVSLSYRAFKDSALLPDQSTYMWFTEANLKVASDLSDTLRFVSDIQVGADGSPYFDIEVGKLISSQGSFSSSIGIDTVHWAKTETAHLSNILNQDDLRRGIDIDDQVGRPMVSVSYLSEIGLFEAYYLPYVVEREFPRKGSRLRTQIPITADALYEDSREEWTPSYAVRYSHSIDKFDIGASIYSGVDLEPSFVPVGEELAPFYGKIQQVGMDMQYTSGAFALKTELRHTRNQQDLNMVVDNVSAATVGVEYTFNGVAGGDADLTFIGEYAYDSRDRSASTPLQDDIILGARLRWNTINATEIEVFHIKDFDFGTKIINAEISHRITDNLSASLSAQKFLGVAQEDMLFGLRGDDNLRISLTHAF